MLQQDAHKSIHIPKKKVVEQYHNQGQLMNFKKKLQENIINAKFITININIMQMM